MPPVPLSFARRGTTAFLLLCWLPLAAVAQSTSYPYWQSYIPFVTVGRKAVNPVANPQPSVYFTRVSVLMFSPDGTQLAVASGEEAELTLIFQVPENADMKRLSLVLLDSPPIALGS